jgi:hypothetical protein
VTDSPTTRCPLCGTATGAARCPVCGSPVAGHATPPTPHPTIPVALASTQVHGAAPSSPGPRAPGLETSVRDAQPSLDLHPPPGHDDVRAAAKRRAMIAAGVVGSVLLVVAGIQLGARGESSENATQPAGSALDTSEVTQAQPDIATPEGTVPPEQPAVTSTPVLRVPADGTWIVVLESKPKTESDVSGALTLATTIGSSGPSVEVIDSDVTPGLNPGYWVVIHGEFATRAEAAQACSSFGREVGGECYPRLVG